MRISLLDHGYIEFVEAWGHGGYGEEYQLPAQAGFSVERDLETGIIAAARQSTQGSFRGWDEDAKLLEFLYKNDHAMPFEFAGMIVEVYAPISVFREWHRHRTQSYNEASARYAPLPPDNYVPTLDRVLLAEPGSNKQAQAVKGSEQLTEMNAKLWRECLIEHYNKSEAFYQYALQLGIPKELARLSMPVGHYSRMRAACTLRSWLAFLTLRMDPKAQWEIRQYANAVGEFIGERFPRTWELFKLYK